MHDVMATVTRVIDGDTFVCTIHGHLLDMVFDFKNQYIRIIGVDTPELQGKTYVAGMIAKNFLENLILGKQVRLHSEGKRSFHRILAEVFYNDQNVAEILIREGLGIRDDG